MEHTTRAEFDLTRLRQELKPFRLYWFPRLRSTNDHAAELRRRGELFAPAVVLAGRQTAGRGRGRHAWWSSAGSLTATFALPIEENLAPQQLSLAVGLAVRNALSELSGTAAVGLKWPNDVVHQGQKLAGVLCERTHHLDLVGIGINLNIDLEQAPAELRRRITSLHLVAGRPIDPTTALVRLAHHLLKTAGRRNEHPFAALLREYSHYDDLAGHDVRISDASDAPAVCGRCEGVDSTGRLMVRSDNRLHRVVAGHVEML